MGTIVATRTYPPVGRQIPAGDTASEQESRNSQWFALRHHLRPAKTGDPHVGIRLPDAPAPTCSRQPDQEHQRIAARQLEIKGQRRHDGPAAERAQIFAETTPCTLCPTAQVDSRTSATSGDVRSSRLYANANVSTDRRDFSQKLAQHVRIRSTAKALNSLIGQWHKNVAQVSILIFLIRRAADNHPGGGLNWWCR